MSQRARAREGGPASKSESKSERGWTSERHRRARRLSACLSATFLSLGMNNRDYKGGCVTVSSPGSKPPLTGQNEDSVRRLASRSAAAEFQRPEALLILYTWGYGRNSDVLLAGSFSTGIARHWRQGQHNVRCLASREHNPVSRAELATCAQPWIAWK